MKTVNISKDNFYKISKRLQKNLSSHLSLSLIQEKLAQAIGFRNLYALNLFYETPQKENNKNDLWLAVECILIAYSQGKEKLALQWILNLGKPLDISLIEYSKTYELKNIDSAARKIRLVDLLINARKYKILASAYFLKIKEYDSELFYIIFNVGRLTKINPS